VPCSAGFLELGGDSLSGLRVVSKVRELFGVSISLEALLHSQATIESFVACVQAELATDATVVEQ
jgi:acyl carrier protein